jgi:hypothetical protein
MAAACYRRVVIDHTGSTLVAEQRPRVLAVFSLGRSDSVTHERETTCYGTDQI